MGIVLPVLMLELVCTLFNFHHDKMKLLQNEDAGSRPVADWLREVKDRITFWNEGRATWCLPLHTAESSADDGIDLW